MSNQVRGTTTNFTKLASWDIDFYNGLGDESCLVCLTEKELYVLRNGLRQVKWHTRWTSELGTQISADIRSDISENLSEKLDMVNCVELCNEIIVCIDETPELQAKIAQYGIDVSPEQTSPENQFNLDKGLIVYRANCDNDTTFGMCGGLVDLLDSVSRRILSVMQSLVSPGARIGDMIETIPLIGQLPIDDIYQFTEAMMNDIAGGYDAFYDTLLRNDIACKLFCEASIDCNLSLEDARDIYHVLFAQSIVTTDVRSFLISMIGNIYTGNATVYGLHLLILEIMIFGGRIQTMDVDRLTNTVLSLFNDPDGDWLTLCTTCGWLWIDDFLVSQNIWMPQQNVGFDIQATWSIAIGYESSDGLVTTNDYSRILGIETSVFTPTQIDSISIDFDLTKGSINNGGSNGLVIVAVKNNDTQIRLDLTFDNLVTGNGQTKTLIVNETDIKSIRFFIKSSRQVTASYSGSVNLLNVTVAGVGFNPFV